MNGFLEWFFNARFQFNIRHSPTFFSGSPAYFTALFLAWAGSCLWVSVDAQRRGKSAAGALFFALFAWWPFSILWWRWLRPPVLPASAQDHLSVKECILLALILLAGAGVIAFALTLSL